MMKKKILITGVKGFLGAFICKHFKQTYDVVGIDIHKSTNDDYKYYCFDLLQDDLVYEYKKIKPDIIIHCAGSANVGESIKNPLKDFEGNVKILYKLLVELRKSGLSPKILFCSSAAVYGNPRNLPISEEHSTNPVSPYGLHKKVCEDICRYFNQNYGFDVKILRIFSAYGVGLRKQIIWDMYQKYRSNGDITLFGSGEESRDFINVIDIARIMEAILETEKNYTVYNVATGKEIKIKELAAIFGKELGISEGDIRFSNVVKQGDPANWCADIERIKEVGFRQSVDIFEGIRECVRWLVEGEHEKIYFN